MDGWVFHLKTWPGKVPRDQSSDVCYEKELQLIARKYLNELVPSHEIQNTQDK